MFLYSLGFGLAVSWLWLFYLQGPLLSHICTLWHISPETLFYYYMTATSLTCLVLTRMVKVHSLLHKKSALALCTFLLSLCSLLNSILPFVIQNSSPLIPYTLAILSGIASAIFNIAWMETIAVKSVRQSTVMFGTAITIASLITILGELVDYYWLLPCLVLFPPISLLLMFRQIPLKDTLVQEYPRIDSIMPFPRKLIVFLCLIYMAGGTIFNIICTEQAYAHMFYLSNLSYAFFCLVAGIALYYYEELDLRIIYQLILLLLSVGFLLFCFHEATMKIAALAFLQGGLALLDMYTWLVFPYFSRFSSRPAGVCAVGLFTTTFSVIMGNAIISTLSSAIFGEHNMKNIAFIASIASVLTIFLFPDKKETFSGWDALFSPKPEPILLERQESLLYTEQPPDKNTFDNLPLSTREKEVLALLLKGRNSRFISEHLNISNNTVKFHTRNIYMKLTVNSRQELLTRFENQL
ncbi:MAG: helix-turn-helix transcriptional regulator [Pelosinus sp.]|nr:helix-turn-helix transcriptional regulator [Pelosinus sp.]